MSIRAQFRAFVAYAWSDSQTHVRKTNHNNKRPPTGQDFCISFPPFLSQVSTARPHFFSIFKQIKLKIVKIMPRKNRCMTHNTHTRLCICSRDLEPGGTKHHKQTKYHTHNTRHTTHGGIDLHSLSNSPGGALLSFAGKLRTVPIFFWFILCSTVVCSDGAPFLKKISPLPTNLSLNQTYSKCASTSGRQKKFNFKKRTLYPFFLFFWFENKLWSVSLDRFGILNLVKIVCSFPKQKSVFSPLPPPFVFVTLQSLNWSPCGLPLFQLRRCAFYSYSWRQVLVWVKKVKYLNRSGLSQPELWLVWVFYLYDPDQDLSPAVLFPCATFSYRRINTDVPRGPFTSIWGEKQHGPSQLKKPLDPPLGTFSCIMQAT